MKFAVGEKPNVRQPGDVGLACDHIYVPHWANLAMAQRIRLTAQGNLLGGVMARLQREAGGTQTERAVKGRLGVYNGEVPVGGSRLMGYIARSPRVRAPVGKGGRKIRLNQGRPCALLIAIGRATYEPVLQQPFQEAVAEAVNNVHG